MKKGLVMEGGALRGLFTAGVIDVLLENNIVFDGAIGVSAGAAFGCNYKSGQIGRTIRYNRKYCNDKRYCGWGSWLKTGNFYNEQFAYIDLPQKLDVFDIKAFQENPMEFYIVATDVTTGKPFYKKLEDGGPDDVKWIRASSAMPMMSKVVEVDGGFYLDGGTSDSIPIEYFESIGYNRNIVVTTQPEGFAKEPNKFMFFIKLFCRKYPKMIEAVANRHNMYNHQLKYLEDAEKAGRTFVIRPKVALNIKPGERNVAELDRVYNLGREQATEMLDDIKKFLEN